MTDVFISYSHEDQEFVRKLVRALEEEGFSVWWDHTIPPGQTWESHIERHIQAAKACIVVWSPVSIASDWVKEEATTAQQAGKLLPIRTQNAVQPPMGFRRIQAASFQNWRGARNAAELTLLVGEVRRLARGDNGAPVQRPQSVPPPRSSSPRKPFPIALVGGGAAALVVITFFVFLGLRPSNGGTAPPIGTEVMTSSSDELEPERTDSTSARSSNDDNAPLRSEQQKQRQSADETERVRQERDAPQNAASQDRPESSVQSLVGTRWNGWLQYDDDIRSPLSVMTFNRDGTFTTAPVSGEPDYYTVTRRWRQDGPNIELTLLYRGPPDGVSFDLTYRGTISGRSITGTATNVGHFGSRRTTHGRFAFTRVD